MATKKKAAKKKAAPRKKAAKKAKEKISYKTYDVITSPRPQSRGLLFSHPCP